MHYNGQVGGSMHVWLHISYLSVLLWIFTSKDYDFGTLTPLLYILWKWHKQLKGEVWVYYTISGNE